MPDISPLQKTHAILIAVHIPAFPTPWLADTPEAAEGFVLLELDVEGVVAGFAGFDRAGHGWER